MHPFKSQADSSHKSKRSAMSAKGDSKLPNLSQNGAYKDVKESTGNLQQHKDQNAAPGMKRGGRLDKSKRSKKSPIAREPLLATPPSPEDMIAAQAGAGGISPPSAPASPMMPPQMMKKRGGSIKKAGGGGVGKPVPMPTLPDKSGDKMNADTSSNTPDFLKGKVAKASGGSVGKYPITGGQATGVARLEQAKKK